MLRRAALAMDGMTWKGRKTSSEQGLAWPRREVLLDQEIKPNNYLPARIQYGQMALAAEIHQDDIDPVEKRTCPEYIIGSHRWGRWFRPARLDA